MTTLICQIQFLSKKKRVTSISGCAEEGEEEDGNWRTSNRLSLIDAAQAVVAAAQAAAAAAFPE